MKNSVPNSFFEIIDKALLGLRREDLIEGEDREIIMNILQTKIRWEK